MLAQSQWQLVLVLAATIAPVSLDGRVMTEGFAQYLLDTGRLVQRFRGNLESGKSYLLSIDYSPPLLLLLRSLHGDADLYVSGSGRTPSPVDYDVKSENFSVDLVFVSEDLRPHISALIFASPQCSDNATYVLELYRHDALLDEYAAIRDEVDTRWTPPDDAGFASGAPSGSRSPTASAQESESAGSFLYNLLVQLGRLLLFILEVAVET